MTITDFTTFLTDTGIVTLDGAWGTELNRRGLPVDLLPEAWNLAEPDKVAEVPR